MNLKWFFIPLLMIFFNSCADKNDKAVLPKPRQYPKVTFEERNYTTYKSADCNFQFELPASALIERDPRFRSENEGRCWFDIVYPQFNGRLHCSYYDLQNRQDFDDYIADAFEFVNKHNIKANFLKESLIKNEDASVAGILFELEGPVATPYQFFVSDSSQHFFRGSLYFFNRVQNDSMQIIYDYVKQDVDHMIETFEWE